MTGCNLTSSRYQSYVTLLTIENIYKKNKTAVPKKEKEEEEVEEDRKYVNAVVTQQPESSHSVSNEPVRKISLRCNRRLAVPHFVDGTSITYQDTIKEEMFRNSLRTLRKRTVHHMDKSEHTTLTFPIISGKVIAEWSNIRAAEKTFYVDIWNWEKVWASAR